MAAGKFLEDSHVLFCSIGFSFLLEFIFLLQERAALLLSRIGLGSCQPVFIFCEGAGLHMALGPFKRSSPRGDVR